MNGWSRYLPGLVAGAAALYLCTFAWWPHNEPEGQPRLGQFARLPVMDEGRVKPIDSVAHNDLLVVSSRQEYTDQSGTTRPAVKWLLDVMTSQLTRDHKESTALKEKVFRIDNDEVRTMLGLEDRPGDYRYALAEFVDKIGLIAEKASEAQQRQKETGKQGDLVDRKLVELAQHLQIYVNLAQLDSPEAVPPSSHGEQWQTLVEAVSQEKATGRENPAARSLATMLLAYANNDPDTFNRELERYQDQLRSARPDEVRRAEFEAFLNDFAPFFHCTILYVLVFLLACVSWVIFPEPLRRSAFWLLVVTLVVHSFALLSRMYLMNRWFVFVTNLYSSAVFIGWACAILGLILERLVFRNGLGTAMAAVLGFATAIIAHNLQLIAGGETLEKLQAVLDTNFWLATHVTCVTIGYAATFLAGGLGFVFVLLRLFSILGARLDRDMFRGLSQAIYGIVCFATLFSFTGTVLGGIWADQSWGRFWGWDPKENGALIIVLWNALVLHARWGGMVKQRGMAVLTLGGNIVTAWSWFGVNMLGVGLHSYGFMEKAFPWLVAFVISQLVWIGVGLLPASVGRLLTAR